MKQSKAIIENNLEKNPEFQYHLDTHFLKIAENLESHPDIAIEACKSFMESIAKTIIKKDEGDDFSEKKYKNLKFPDASGMMLRILRTYTIFPDEFADKLFELMRIFGNYRNETGDISHGRASPKEKISTTQDAIFIMQMTDNLCQYFLGIYFAIDSWELEELTDYYDEKFIELNQFLDEENPIEGVSYSRALFEQDLPAYMDRYDNFVTT